MKNQLPGPSDVEILNEIDLIIIASTERNFAEAHQIFDRYRFKGHSNLVMQRLTYFQDVNILKATDKQPLGFYFLDGIPDNVSDEVKWFLRQRAGRR